MGEYGIGYLSDHQKLNEDVLGPAKFYDSTLHNVAGGAVRLKNVISVREEDAGK